MAARQLQCSIDICRTFAHPTKVEQKKCQFASLALINIDKRYIFTCRHAADNVHVSFFFSDPRYALASSVRRSGMMQRLRQPQQIASCTFQRHHRNSAPVYAGRRRPSVHSAASLPITPIGGFHSATCGQPLYLS